MNLTYLTCAAVALIFVRKCAGDDFKLLVLHNNDMHSRFEETSRISGVCKTKGSCYGGFARVLHVVREARKAAEEGAGPRVLFLNAGDTYTGTSWFGVHRWKIVVDFMNLIRPDAVSLGNHEFDNRIGGLLPYVNGVNFPIVAANLDFSHVPSRQKINVTKSHVFEIAGRKIGVIGYLTPQTAEISSPEQIKFLDEVESIRNESERLDAEGAKIIIAVGHSGYDTDKKIAREVPLVDLVVGGHTNTFLWNGPKPDLEEPEGPYPTVVEQSNGKKVPVVQAYAYTKYMGRLYVTFNEIGNAVDYYGAPQLLDSSVAEDEDALRLLEQYRPSVLALDEEVIGSTRVVLDGSVANCRQKECNFGNLIADAIVSYHSADYEGTHWTDAPIALVNGGSIRNSIEPNGNGTITRGELLGVMPFDNRVISMSLNGSDLLRTLEIGVRGNGETSYGELLQTSGVHYRFDRSRPVGSRVVYAKVRCGSCNIPTYKPVVSHYIYRIITTEFLDFGGDGHTVLRDNGFDKVAEDKSDLDIVVWYIKKTSPVHPEEEERLTVVPKDDGNCGGGARIVTITPTILAMSVIIVNLVNKSVSNGTKLLHR